jgi:hypothetical protein
MSDHTQSGTIRRFASTVCCVGAAACGTPDRIPVAGADASLAVAEATFQDVRALRDAMDVAGARGTDRVEDGESVAGVAMRYAPTVQTLQRQLAGIDSTKLDSIDRRALRTMRLITATELMQRPNAPTPRQPVRPDCAYDAATIAASPDGLRTLSTRIYACYGDAAERVTYGNEVLDRLTVLGRLAGTANAAERERLFRALTPMFRTIDGDGGPSSPYRHLVRLSAARWRAEGSPVADQARSAGVEPARMEQWLVSILTRWRDVTPDSLIEPWDYDYVAGTAERALDPLIEARGLTYLNAAFHRSLGVNLDTLGVHLDLAPRSGKTPVAFTTFGRRSRLVDGRWSGGSAWVFATYRSAGLGLLNELLHETGHAVHIAAIRTRPAFFSWPDTDAFTEGLADIASLEIHEPAWQQRWLGDSVPLADGLRSRYAAIIMDVCWALFEIRMHANPTADPNAVWAELTSEYLHITPHPEMAWWARRGQLVDSPGYMANYAIGAIMIADIRARVKSVHGDYARGDATWYPWVSSQLYRFGLERSSRQVIEDFLRRPLSPAALLADLARMSPG